MQQIWKNQFEQNSTRLLFRSDINNMAFVLFLHQQHGFWFLPTSTIWLSKMTTAGKTRRGCMNPQMPGSHQSSLKKSRNWMTQCSDWQGKAMIGLGSDKNWWKKFHIQLEAKSDHIFGTMTSLNNTVFAFFNINHIVFVFIWHRQHGFCFVLSSTNRAVVLLQCQQHGC